MRNRFNLNEEEKNRIRGLHGMQVINEQEDHSIQKLKDRRMEWHRLTPAEQQLVTDAGFTKKTWNEMLAMLPVGKSSKGEDATLESKIAMVDCAETYDIPELVINLAGTIADNMMSAVPEELPEGNTPYSIWMAGFISNVFKDKRTDPKLLTDIKSDTGCMYELLKTHDMLTLIPG